jgi:acetyl-CoA acetyltransferase
MVPVRRRLVDRETGRVYDTGDDVAVDESIRADLTSAELAALPSAFTDVGLVTAANMAAPADGAGAALVTTPKMAATLGIEPRARVHAASMVAGDPVAALDVVMAATIRVLDLAGLGVTDIDRFEIDESSAALVLAWLATTKADPERVNVGGGALARGRPAGAAGLISLVELVAGLERSGGSVGLAVSGGSGQAAAVLIERAG